jgi:hypothetical protein
MSPYDWNSYLAAEAEVDEQAETLTGETTGVLRWSAESGYWTFPYSWLALRKLEEASDDPRP